MTAMDRKGVFSATPAAADPAETARVLAELAANASNAVRAAHARALSPQPLPYDPFAPAKAFTAFQMALMSRPLDVMQRQMDAAQEWAQLWTSTASRALGLETEPVVTPQRGDRRFSSPAWSEEPAFDALKQAYLLAAQQLADLVETAELDPETHAKVDFFSRSLMNALSPSNNPLTNPDAVRKTLETGGLNLLQGLSNLLEDLGGERGLVKRRVQEAFELGETIAATPGQVVFENDLLQLIQYAPSTEQVFKRPLLFVPPLVNKYYLFDLTPRSSFLKWLVDEGHTVFVISWANPDETLRDKGLDAYVTEGVIAAMDAVQKATGEADLDLVSYCLGGTLVAITLALLAARGEAGRVASATLIASLVDFSEIGEWSAFRGEDDLRAFEAHLDHKGYVEAHDLARLFSAVRANDLIWGPAVSHYLLAEEGRPSDLLWWFDDAARIPARFLKDYGRKVLRENRLTEGGLTIDGTTIDLKAVKTPVHIVAFKDDHVSSWRRTFENLKAFGGKTRFILGGSGHNAGMINPPSAGKHGFWTGDDKAPDADAWFAGAAKHEGSWWPAWRERLAGAKAAKVDARTPGEGGLPAIEPAPGRYVRVRY
ncbi:alpha/beta fold hydrolase [Brevundimonas sp. 2R-24]|uniref:Alpha/beta fold hydrolase n=1 Tax=Peiella sedimenti TaxID=3061083 RepID=A0ABT8SKX3_9CAUL|nr:alpha/beta fold hydrolase [Caulobacteraceae bacterium XZ-24]